MSPIQDMKRSRRKKSAAPKKKTIPLPLEIVFKPEVRGKYDPGKADWLDVKGESYSPLKEGFVEAFARFQFVPGSEVTEPVEDPWIMREAILREDDDASFVLDGITFAYGRFGVGIEDLTVSREKVGDKGCDAWQAARLLREEYMEWRSLVRAAMRTEIGKWAQLKERFPSHKVDRLCQPMALAIEWQSGRPTGVITCSGVIQALIATLQVDVLLHAEYRFCACAGCPNSFKVKRKDQRYCSEVCKHRQVVRDGRIRQHTTTQQLKGSNGRGKNEHLQAR